VVSSASAFCDRENTVVIVWGSCIEILVMSRESRRQAWERKQQRLEAARQRKRERRTSQRTTVADSNHPLVTPRVSTGLALIALVIALGAPLMPSGTVPWAIGVCYLLTAATGWLLRDEFRACLALVKGQKWSEISIPNDFWLVVFLLFASFSISTYVLTTGEASSVKITRSAFSDTQFIRVLPSDMGGNMVLNLDNVGTLRLHAPYSSEKITMLLDVVPISAPNQHLPGVEFRDIETYNQSTGTQYTFDTDKDRRHEVKVANRTFLVTLMRIKKLDVPNVPVAIEYQFGISEK
jgi:hypothetical protein